MLTPWLMPEIAAPGRAERRQRGGRRAAPRADRRRPSTVIPNGLDPQDWAVEPAERDAGDGARRLHDAAVGAQAPAAAARRGAGRAAPSCPTAPRAAAHGVRRRQADAADARLHRPARDVGHGATWPAGSTARELQGDLPHAPTFSSRRRSSSRSASPPSRRAAPGCRCSPCAAPGSPSSSPTGVEGLLADGDARHGRRAGADHAGRRSARSTIADHNRTTAAADLLGRGAGARMAGEYDRGARSDRTRIRRRPRRVEDRE